VHLLREQPPASGCEETVLIGRPHHDAAGNEPAAARIQRQKQIAVSADHRETTQTHHQRVHGSQDIDEER